MTRIVLQPSANPASRQHYADTIEKPVQISQAESFLTPELISDLQAIYPTGAMSLWGTTPGERSQHVTKWERIQSGDYLMFAASKKLFAGAVVTKTFRSQSFAKELWGETTTANGTTQTWELMFAITEVQELDISYETLNRIVGRAPNAAVQEFNVLPEDSSRTLLDHVNLSENSFQRSVQIPSNTYTPEFEEMEREVFATRRMEQQALRNFLLAGPNTKCELCGRAFPAEFLTAAHIKRRSICTDEEKRQLAAVAMLNCRFGCDELFGKGFVSVDGGGRIQLSELLQEGPAHQYAIKHLANQNSAAWAERVATREFFEFHFMNDFKRAASA